MNFGAFFIPKYELIGYADDSTLVAVVLSSGFKVTVAESYIRDLYMVSEWFNEIESKLDEDYYSLQVTNNLSPVTPLTIGGTVLKESDDLHILGVTFDSIMILSCIFALFPEHLLKVLASWNTPGEYSMTDCF